MANIDIEQWACDWFLREISKWEHTPNDLITFSQTNKQGWISTFLHNLWNNFGSDLHRALSGPRHEDVAPTAMRLGELVDQFIAKMREGKQDAALDLVENWLKLFAFFGDLTDSERIKLKRDVNGFSVALYNKMAIGDFNPTQVDNVLAENRRLQKELNELREAHDRVCAVMHEQTLAILAARDALSGVGP